jgi:murein DD-endopeptidase MepM/ murein hydrolase activator NlpD
VTARRDSALQPGRGRLLVASAALAAILLVALLGALGRVPLPADPAPAVAATAPATGPSTEAPATAAATPAAGTPAILTPANAVAAAPAPPAPPVRMSVLTVRLARNQTLSQALARLQLAPGQARAIMAALANKFPFRRSRPGDQIRVERVEGETGLRRFTYRQSAAEEWSVVPDQGGALRGEKRAVVVTTEVARIDVEIRGSVWESLQRAGEDPALAVLAADVLAFDVDFYQDVRAGDRMKVLVEKVLADGKLLRYGEVLAAGYEGEVTGAKRLFRYTDPAGQTSYYDDQGHSARRGFLKSPLKYAHLTSGFGARVHPVLGYVKAHQGLDYGAPSGTPVWAVGDGTVSQAGWNGACGRSVTLHHRNGLDTMYCHLSAVAVRAGARVSQKQLIGAVGTTGRSTGPHLHYAVRRNGAFVNPLSLKVPREAPLAPAYRSDFEGKVAPLRAKLDGGPTV